MPYVVPSPHSSPLNNNDQPLPSPSSSISFRLDSSDCTPSSSQSSSRSGSEDEQGTPDSSPPTPEATRPKLTIWSKDKLSTEYIEDARPFRNHIRSQSLDQLASLNRYPLSPAASDQSNSPMSSLIFLQAAPDAEDDADFRSARATTVWPEGDSTEADSSPRGRHTDLWSPPTESQASTSFPFGGVTVTPTNGNSNANAGSRSVTPKPTLPGQSVLHTVRPQRPSLTPSISNASTTGSSLRINTERSRARSTSGSSPLPTPMVRKKSGELVRSSLKQHSRTPSEVDEEAIRQLNAHATPEASGRGSTRSARAKSAPATPTGPKAVHFDKQLEHVKLFLAQQRPAAVSRQGSPGETTEEESEAYPFPPMYSDTDKLNLILDNFPVPAPTTSCGKDVFLQSMDVDQPSKVLRGIVIVRNLSFHKRVVVRFTSDDWQTVSETTAEWQASLENGSFDQWLFKIKLQDMLARIESKKLFLVIKYSVDGRDLWDNNDGRNYAVQFKREIPQSRPKAIGGPKRQSQYQWSVTTENQASERMADLRRELDRLVQDENGDLPIAQGSLFGHRYDFGASLREQPKRPDAKNGMAPASKIPEAYFSPQSSISGLPLSGPTLHMPQPQPRYAQFEVDGVLHKDYGMPQYSVSPQVHPNTLYSDSTWPPGDNLRQHPSSSLSSSLESNSSATHHPIPPALTPRMFEESAVFGNGTLASTDSPDMSPRSLSPDIQRRPLPVDRRARSPPPRRASPDLSTPPSSDASYASPHSPTRSGSPDNEANLLKRNLPKIGADGETPSYNGFLERVSLPSLSL